MTSWSEAADAARQARWEAGVDVRQWGDPIADARLARARLTSESDLIRNGPPEADLVTNLESSPEQQVERLKTRAELTAEVVRGVAAHGLGAHIAHDPNLEATVRAGVEQARLLILTKAEQFGFGTPGGAIVDVDRATAETAAAIAEQLRDWRERRRYRTD